MFEQSANEEEVYRRFEVGHGHVIEALTRMNQGEFLEWWKIPVDEFPDFVTVVTTTLYGMVAYLAYRDGTSVEGQIQRLAIEIWSKIEEERNGS